MTDFYIKRRMTVFKNTFAEILVWTISLSLLSIQYVISGFCHDFLVGGPNGVDKAFSAHGTESSRNSPPHIAYLYQPYDNRYYAAAWCAAATFEDPWLQADLKKDMVIRAVVTRGSPNTDRVTYKRAHVTKFTLKYKADGGNWITFTDEQGRIKNFIGNTDDLKRKQNYFQKMITARYVRIYPTECVHRYCLQLDLIGCTKETVEKDKKKIWQASLHNILASNDGLLGEMNMKNHAFCGKYCYEDVACESFAFDPDNGKCQGYDRQMIETINEDSASNVVFFKRVYSACENGELKLSDNCFKTYMFEANMDTADTICRQNGAYLAQMNTNKTRSTIWAENMKNRIVASETAFYVSGKFDNNEGSWALQNGQEIPNEVWAENQPELSNGKCVFLTKDGLISGDCSSLHWFICSRTLA